MESAATVGRAVVSGRERLAGIAASPWFAYGSVVLIQSKVLWGIWQYRDLSAGDTSNYFVNANAWAEHLEVDPLFSPLYTAFWGSLKWIFNDVYAVTIAHRVVIAAAVSILVLAVLRRLLSPSVAWAMAVWWALLPVNYDTLNEVHLFSLLPILVAILVALRYSGTRMRAAVFGILLGAAVVQRNETLVAALAWLVICLAYEWYRRRRALQEGKQPTPPRRVLTPIGVATLAVILLAALTLWRSADDLSASGWIHRAQWKQDFALCQHYAVGYQQRHHADPTRGWLDCESFMQRDFGSPQPSFFEALASNPSAMGGHFGWNATLFPYAVQLALFDRTSGSDFHDPDYVPVDTGSLLVLTGSLAVLAFVALGFRLLWIRRQWWWSSRLRARAWGWAAIGCSALLGIWVAITTHPRPAYIFPFNFALFALIGMCAMAVAERWPALGRLRAAVPVAALLLVVLVPSHYQPGYANPLSGPGRGAAAMVSRLEPYRDELRGENTTLLGPHSFEVCNYLLPEDPCEGSHLGLLDPRGGDANEWLARNGVDFVYADETVLADPSSRLALARLQRQGWRRLGPANPRSAGWLLLG
ncbi:MAG TPA: hypothetical protein VLB79_03785 [Solirubrobacterales bacterium]|nr:hypothetical protein [Solirubrobacterales bacterium]